MLNGARQRPLETCQLAFPRPRLAFIVLRRIVVVGLQEIFTVSSELMCGRFTLRSRDRIKIKGLSNSELPFEARYNIAPGQTILAIADFGHGPEPTSFVWGLIPWWSNDGKGFINARCETLEAKPSFSESFQQRRCLIPSDGFFEWRRLGRSKQPFYLQLKDESPFSFAGIWDQWGNGEQLVTSCAIITTAANELIGPLHDRMPAILLPESYDLWLSSKTDPALLKKLLMPFPTQEMKAHPVSSAVNYPENDNDQLITRVDVEVGTTPSLF
jgi:putative SOS response-associated peptidase YedK